MARYAQNLFYVGFDQQASKGTAVAPAYFPEYFDGDVGVTPEFDFTHYTPADGQFVNLGLVERFRQPANFTILATPQMAGALFSYLLGTDSKSGAADPYTHTITCATRDSMPWVTIEASVGYDSGQTDPIIIRFVDARIGAMTISCENGMPLMLNPSWQAINLSKETTETSVSHESNDPLTMNQATLTLDSGTTTNIIDFSIDFTNVLDEDDYTNDMKRQDLSVLRREATISYTLKLTDGTRFFDTFMKADHSAILEALNTGDFTAYFNNSVTDGSAGDRSIKIELPNLDHTNAEPNPGIGDGTLEYSCEAIVRKGAGNFITVTTDDDNSSAYVS